MIHFHYTLLFDIPFAAFDGFSFVVQFFTLAQGDIAFDLAALPEQAERDHGITFSVHRADQVMNFLFIEQQFAASGWVRHYV